MIRAYHGSPFIFDKFSLTKLGTGDGRKIGGWGLYFNAIRELAQQYVTKSGALYRVDIIEAGDAWFDLDEPLPIEHSAVITAMLKTFKEERAAEEFEEEYGTDEDVTGQQAYDWLSAVLGSQKEASLFLLKCGFVGNKFEDRGTVRTYAMQSGNFDLINDPNANYVVFDEDRVVIKEIDYEQLP